jgi:hypothetical protein
MDRISGAARAALLALLITVPGWAATPIVIDAQKLRVTIDPAACRWSASVRNTAMQINKVYFLPGDDPAGWTVTSAVNNNAVANDPYQLRIYLPDGFTGKRVELQSGLTGTLKTEGNLLTVDFTATTGDDVVWKVYF